MSTVQSITSFCAGAHHTCALSGGPNSVLKCFGDNEYGQLGLGLPTASIGGGEDQMGTNLPPVLLGFSDGVPAEVVCGAFHTCVQWVAETWQKTKCWGLNGSGQLLLGDTDDRGLLPDQMGEHLPATKWGTDNSNHVRQVALGSEFTCAILGANTIKCAGANQYGQLGGDSTASSDDTIGDDILPVNLGEGLPVVRLFTGPMSNHVCASFGDGDLKCWGNNLFGQLGLGDTNSRGDEPGEMGEFLLPVDLGGDRKAVQVALGATHTCAILDDAAHSTVCWGANESGQLGRIGNSVGDGTLEMGSNLLAASNYTDRVSAGSGFTCIMQGPNPEVKCVGNGSDGRTGQGSTTNLSAFSLVNLGSSNVVEDVITGHGHVCVVFVNNSKVKCWGLNDKGQLGLGNGLPAVNMGASLPYTYIFENPVATTVPSSMPPSATTMTPSTTPFSLTPSGYGANTNTPSKAPNSNTMQPTIDGTTTTSTSKPSEAPIPGHGTNTITPSKNPYLAPSASSGTTTPSKSPNAGSTSKYPSRSPSKAPSPYQAQPTSKPSPWPSKSPSKSPSTANPTDSPTRPTPPSKEPSKSPSLSPVTKAPTKSPVIPTTKSPTNTELQAYNPPPIDCSDFGTETACVAEQNAACGECLFISDKASYLLRVRIDFVMDGTRRFTDFENTSPKRTHFADSVKALLKENIPGVSKITITRIGQVQQLSNQQEGNVVYELAFHDSETNKAAAKAWLLDNGPNHDYTTQLNAQLNKKMDTTGVTYMTGSFKISTGSITDQANGLGVCECASDVGSGSLPVGLEREIVRDCE